MPAKEEPRLALRVRGDEDEGLPPLGGEEARVNRELRMLQEGLKVPLLVHPVPPGRAEQFGITVCSGDPNK